MTDGNEGSTATEKMRVLPARRPRWLIPVATALTLAVAGAVVVFVTVYLKPLVEERVKKEALARGVDIVFSGVSFWVTSASLENARFRLVDVPQIEGTASTIDVSLSNWEPTQIEADEVKVAVTGSAADLALSLPAWAAHHPQAFQVPVSAHGIGVTFRPDATANPWLSIDGGALTDGTTGVTFSAAHAVVSGLDVGAVAASWTAEKASVTMSFGAADPKNANVQLTVQHAAKPPTATVVLAPTPLAKLSGPLGVPLLAPGAVVSGRVDLSFTDALESGPVTGDLQSRLEGWIPPHPAELDGFLFGNVTTFATHLAVDRTRTLIDLSKTAVRAGAFELQGGGRIQRDDTHASVTMNLSGNLSCSAIAQSAAAAHVGTFLSDIVGSAARKILDGSVGVTVKLAADSRHLDAATVVPIIGVGCGITPLRGVDVGALAQLPKKLQDIAKRLPALPALPDLPVFR